jgi:hypothetical protein
MLGADWEEFRHGRARPGHLRLGSAAAKEDAGGRNKSGHDEPDNNALPLSPLLFGETSFPSPHDFMIYDEY